MISEDFEQNIGFRMPFYKFLTIMVEKNLAVLLNEPPDTIGLLVETINWGVEHVTPEVCRHATKLTMTLFDLVARMPETVGPFFEQFYLPVVSHLFTVILDTSHKFAFDEHVELLHSLLSKQHPLVNPIAITEGIMPLIPHRRPDEIAGEIAEMIRLSNDRLSLKERLRDFLVVVRQYSRYDPELNREVQIGARAAQVAAMKDMYPEVAEEVDFLA
jgi:exportin-1